MIRNKTQQTVVAARPCYATTFWQRLRGLMFYPAYPLDQFDALVFQANSIHCSFVRFPIDAVFLDCEYVVVALRENLRPWRLAGARGAVHVIELPGGRIEQGLSVGDQLLLHA